MKRLILSLTILAVLVTAGGCGGGGGGDRLSKEEYTTRVAAVGHTLESSFSSIASEAGPLASGDFSSLGDIQEALGGLADVLHSAQDALGQAADDLESLNPPEDAENANDQLAQGLRLLSSEFDDLIAAIEAGDLAKLTEAAGRFQAIDQSEAFKILKQATDDLKAKGYDIEGEEG